MLNNVVVTTSQCPSALHTCTREINLTTILMSLGKHVLLELLPCYNALLRHLLKDNPDYTNSHACSTPHCLESGKPMKHTNEAFTEHAVPCGSKRCRHCRQTWAKDHVCAEYQVDTTVAASSRPCPDCGRRIDRIDGCEHMLCLKEYGGCNTEFRWCCGIAWNGDYQHHCHHKYSAKYGFYVNKHLQVIYPTRSSGL